MDTESAGPPTGLLKKPQTDRNVVVTKVRFVFPIQRCVCVCVSVCVCVFTNVWQGFGAARSSSRLVPLD